MTMSTSNEVTPGYKKEVYEIATALADRREKFGDRYEWYKALFFYGVEKYKDWRKALKVADLAIAKAPDMPASANSPAVSPEAAEGITSQFPPEFFGEGAGAE